MIVSFFKRALVSAAAICAGQGLAAQTGGTSLPNFVMGQDLYVQNCAICHGPTGEGNGILAGQFSPSPRNFFVGTFRFRSSDFGQPPTREDLIRTITNGIEGSYGRSMPAFDQLLPSEVTALTEVIRDFAGFDEFGEAVDVPPRPEGDLVNEGRALFAANGCYQCHGDSGDGTGILAGELVDESGAAIRPANLTVGDFKGGNAPEDIFLRLKNGIDGTPMPSFGRNLSAEELWALTAYVLSLSGPD